MYVTSHNLNETDNKLSWVDFLCIFRKQEHENQFLMWGKKNINNINYLKNGMKKSNQLSHAE